MRTTSPPLAISVALIGLFIIACQEPAPGGGDPHGARPDVAPSTAGTAAGAASGGGIGIGGTNIGGSDIGGIGIGGAANAAGSEQAGGSVAGSGGGRGGEGGVGTATAGGAVGGTAGAAGSFGTNKWEFPAGVTKPRIMIVGDSISAGPGCYKKYLLQELTKQGYEAFEFVGEYSDDCGGEVRHSAVSCSTAEQYTRETFEVPNCQAGKSFAGLGPLVIKHEPDLVMLQLGVNDVWGGTPTATILTSYTALIEQARKHNPNVALVVAQIQKIRPNCGSDDTVLRRAEELITAVPAWAKALGTAQSPVFVADLWTTSDWSMAETSDCVHPNDIGARKMALSWFNALATILPQR